MSWYFCFSRSLPNSVIERCEALLTWFAFSSRKGMAASGVDCLATAAGMGEQALAPSLSEMIIRITSSVRLSPTDEA